LCYVNYSGTETNAVSACRAASRKGRLVLRRYDASSSVAGPRIDTSGTDTLARATTPSVRVAVSRVTSLRTYTKNKISRKSIERGTLTWDSNGSARRCSALYALQQQRQDSRQVVHKEIASVRQERACVAMPFETT